MRSCKNTVQELKKQVNPLWEKELSDLEEGIGLDGLSLQYPNGKEVFRHLSFHFQVGEHYAVTGNSGSGKSTLLFLSEGNHPDYGLRLLRISYWSRSEQ